MSRSSKSPAPTSPSPPAQSSTPKPPAPMIVRKRGGLSPVWIIPILAALLGGWLVWQHFASLGPLVTVHFETAEGIAKGKTGVQCRSVTIGTVESVRLSGDLQGVVTTLRINQDAAGLLHKDTRFWVVRPRFGGAGISGLGTLVSGTYIELDPGVLDEPGYDFEGLENPPVTPLGVPGLHVTLVADQAGSIGLGSSVIYKGLDAGQVESQELNPDNGRIEFGVFINDEFDHLITSRTRFWNTSGFDLELGANGVRLRTGSLESMVAGGVAFETLEDEIGADPVQDGAIFPLHESYEDTREITLNARLSYLLLFENSVRGLAPEAPVEFRGIQVGSVVGISFDYLPDDPKHRVPVLIHIDPGLIGDFPTDDMDAAMAMIKDRVHNGLRATLRTGSLLTGQLFVDLNLQDDAPRAEVTEAGGHRILPTVSSGLEQLQDKLAAVLDKVQALKIEDTVDAATGALTEIKTTATDLKTAVSSLNTFIASEETQAIPANVKASLDTLNSTLQDFNQDSAIYHDLDRMIRDLSSAVKALESLASSLERKPSSLLWGNPKDTVTPPRGKQ